MKSRLLARSVAAAAFVLCASTAQAGILVPIPPVLGSTATYARDVNNNDVITGSYATPDGQAHGFFGTLDGQYTTFDFGTGDTEPRSIDDIGQITGVAPDPNNGFIIGREFFRGRDGTFRKIVKQGTPLDGIAAGIGTQSQFVGDYWIVDENGHLTVTAYLGKRGRYVGDLQGGCGTYNRARDIAPDGTVVGYCQSAGFHGFILRNGTNTVVDEPNSVGTYLSAINRRGMIAGYACSDDQCVNTHALLYNTAKGQFRDIDVPGATYWYAAGMNDAGVVIIGSDIGSFLYCRKKAVCPDVGTPIRVHERLRARSTRPEGRVMSQDVHVNPSASNRAARDPELQHELRLPFRP
jgi:uncharacterized membrane protein